MSQNPKHAWIFLPGTMAVQHEITPKKETAWIPALKNKQCVTWRRMM
jgi:hypothetical protein